MKNMKTIFFILFLFVSENIFAQSAFAKFDILQATIDGEDQTAWALGREQFLMFYSNEDDQITLSNNCGNCDDYSSGKVKLLDIKVIEETENTYKKIAYKFRWRFYNSYNSEKGEAYIEMTKIYRPYSTDFEMTIFLENDGILEYKGEMRKEELEEGVVDL